MTKLRLALLSLAPFSLADISQCPSSECWTFDATDGCVLKGSTDCGYAVACSTDGMTVTFPHAVFGSESTTDFENPSGVADNSCDPVFRTADNDFSYTQTLDACGTVVERVTDNPGETNAEERIKFKKTFSIAGSTDAGTSLVLADGTSGTIFTQTGTAVTQVTFTCSFPASFEATADQINVAPDAAATGVATESTGVWDGSLTLKYYSDAGFGTELQPDAHNVFIGSTLFVQSEWSVTTLASSLRYYINTCKIKDTATNKELEIVKDSCYAGTIGAEPLGAAAGTVANSKVVGQFSQFKYTSFSFDTTQTSNTQELTCLMEFCVIDGSGGNDCTGVQTHEDTNAVCPTTAGYGYAA